MSIAITCCIVYNTIKGWCFRGGIKMQSKRIITNFIAVLMIMLCAFLSGCGLDNLPKGELIDSSISPNGKYTVNAYLCSGNATTDFSVRREVVDSETSKCRNIYWKYHQEDVSLYWKSDEVVVINDVELNVLTDKYDWRTD